jgi:adenylate cyclase
LIEIERKFLVNNLDFKTNFDSKHHIKQGFLSTDKHRTVRVRLIDEQGYLTVKGISSSDGLERFEWEHQISKKDALQLLKLCKPSIIDKTRYLIHIDTFTFEVDEFYGDNQGLLIAEIELSDRFQQFPKPHWLGAEVTGDIRYYNSKLSEHPFKMWK